MNKIPLITLPGTTLAVSALCLGSADMGTKIERQLSFQLLDAFLDAGGNFIDTAAVYSDWVAGERNRVEKLLGEWLVSSGKRQQIVLATKGAHPELSSMHISRLSQADIAHDILTSLKNLHTDQIDLYWLHRDDTSRPVAEIIDTLNQHVHEGHIRYFGASNWTTARIQAAQTYASSNGLQGFSANQMLWNVGIPNMNVFADKTMATMDDEMWHYHATSGLTAIPYASQANGYFNKLAEKRLDLKSQLARVYEQPENYVLYERIKELAQATGASITQIVLGYLLVQPFASVPILGCGTIAQLTDSLAAATIALDSTQRSYLDYGKQR